MTEMQKSAANLRVNKKAWDLSQEALHPDDPSARLKAPAVTISTVHSVKGAQWADTTVVMTAGKFPMNPRPLSDDKDEDSLNPDQQMRLAERREKDFLTERQLAYVAMTRAAENLTIISQDREGKNRLPVSPFIVEAGLVAGENVKEQPDPLPPQVLKTASDTFLADLLVDEQVESVSLKWSSPYPYYPAGA